MKPEQPAGLDLRTRTKRFALRTMRSVEALPKKMTADILGRQLVRSATSVGANYRAACRARSRPEFIAKMGIVLEEADESGNWMELLMEGGLMSPRKLGLLLQEADELVAISVASIKTAKNRGK